MTTPVVDAHTFPQIPQDGVIEPSCLDLPTFLRTYKMRATQIMWFLGAGASRSAGIKTASDMIWDFKRELYCSQKKLPSSAILDIGDSIVRQKLQSHFDAFGTFPKAGAEDEYSAYFEATYPSARDRRAYLDRLLALGKPSFGHLALALLMQEGLCRAIWTTNFDRTIEDASAKLLGTTSKLVVADLGEPIKLRQAWSENRWPVYGKLHGDYQSERIKNTNEELRSQDNEMRRCLIDACSQQGLAVIGYSGRDHSIMEALNDALSSGRGFPSGLFWFKRSGDNPYPAVVNLLSKAKAVGIEAHFVEVESFDELLSDIVRFLPETSKKALSITQADRPRLIASQPRQKTVALPTIRTNALPVISFPSMCRIVRCTIGGWEEVNGAIEKAAVNIEAQRIKLGILAFGRDADVRRAFEPHQIEGFETHAISPSRLEKETGERSLVRNSLFRAIGNRPGLHLLKRGRSNYLIPDPSNVQPKIFSLDQIAGSISGTNIAWKEACKLRIDYRLETLWLLLEPCILLDIPENAIKDHVNKAKEFARKRRSGRHNRAANTILDGWVNLIAGNEQSLKLRAFGITDGYDADFEITRISGFSGITK